MLEISMLSLRREHTFANQPQAVIRWHTFFVVEVPYLTDFLGHYNESDGPERRDMVMQDALSEQVQFIRSMGQLVGDDRALELRYLFEPKQKQIRLFFVCKVVANDQDSSRVQAQNLWAHFQAAFPKAYGRPKPIPISEHELLEGNRILWFPDPSGQSSLYLAEFRRCEAEERLHQDITGYVVYPIEGMPNSMHRLFHFLMKQSQPYLISICLKPTSLSVQERYWLDSRASICRELSESVVQGAISGNQEQYTSISAGNVADIFTNYFHQLENAFLLRITVASPASIQPGLLSEMVSDLSHDFSERSGKLIPNRKGEFVFPKDNAEYHTAWMNLRYLDVDEWGSTLASPEIKRLRRLVDAESASSAFRIPIPPVGGLAGIESRPVSRFVALPEFPPAERKIINLGNAYLDLNNLSKHLLVAGTTGSGKTNTSILILYQLWAKHRVPFLVIEPVNAQHNDYRCLGHFFPIPEELRVFTVGDEATFPLRFNPFEVPTGAVLSGHIAGLMNCFRAALPLDGILPSLLNRAIQYAYLARGWSINDRGGQNPYAETPTLEDLITQLDPMVEEYGGEVKQNIRGALVNRIRGLIDSSVGQTLMAKKSVPLEELFDKPTILELRHLGSDEDRALMIGFILLALQEYCDYKREVGSGTLNHIILVEEAHTLMQKAEGGSAENANPKAGAVEFFTKMLAENRKYGQGFIIAEQIPTLLAEGAIKNTVTKLMHRQPGQDDIEVMGGAMNFKERHKAFAVALKPLQGEALFYTEGMNEATLINVRYFKKDNPLNDEQIKERMAFFGEQYPDVYALEAPFEGCQFAPCNGHCAYRARVQRLAYHPGLSKEVLNAYQAAKPKENLDQAIKQITNPIRREVQKLGFEGDDVGKATYCAFLHLQSQIKAMQNVSLNMIKAVKRRL